jgi:FkbM family methyltransferase
MIMTISRKLKNLRKIIHIVKNYWTYFIVLCGLSKRPFLHLFLRDGTVLHIRNNRNDLDAFTEIWIHDDYTKEGHDVEEGDVVVDIGAHVGLFTLLASQKASKVFSIEPLELNHNQLLINKYLNNKHNISTSKICISGTDGEIELYTHEKEYFMLSMTKQEAGCTKVKVPCVTLKTFMEQNNIQNIDFLKMDCEGSEHAIIDACDNETLRKISKVSAECHDIGERNAKHIVETMRHRGFNVKLVGKMMYAKRTADKKR